MLNLTPFTKDDFDRFISWIVDEKFMYMFAGPAFTYPVTKEQLDNYISEPDRQVYAVIDEETNQIIGHGELNNINSRNKSARLCRILIADKNHRNKGYGEQLILKLLEIGFKEMNLHRIDLGVFDFNLQAIKCYEKCGFKKEGLFRDSFVIQEKYYSTYNMSILKHEWKEN